VLKPAGTPVVGGTVYLADMQNGVYVQDNDMRVNHQSGRVTRSTYTDEQGKFSFRPSVDDHAVIVLEDEGSAGT
jgi:hypothetical protein